MIRDASPVTLPDAPEGYYMRAYKKGDEEDWCKCCINGELGVTEISVSQFERIMLADKRVDTRNIYFLFHESGIVAGTVTYQFGMQPMEGYIHMVGITPEHRGKGLALYMNLFVVDIMIKAGVKSILLTTDDWRLPAIRTYMKCGFVPCITDSAMEKRWDEVRQKLCLKR